MIHSYVWSIADDSIDGETAGWINEAGDDMADVNIEPGQSFLVNLANDDVKFMNAGEVRTQSLLLTTGKKFNFFGNTLPMPINIQDIRLVADDSLISSWGDNIQILGTGGQMVHSYVWSIADDSIDGETAGWINEDGDDMADVELPAGQGFLLNLAYEGVKIYIPGLDDETAAK